MNWLYIFLFVSLACLMYADVKYTQLAAKVNNAEFFAFTMWLSKKFPNIYPHISAFILGVIILGFTGGAYVFFGQVIACVVLAACCLYYLYMVLKTRGIINGSL